MPRTKKQSVDIVAAEPIPEPIPEPVPEPIPVLSPAVEEEADDPEEAEDYSDGDEDSYDDTFDDAGVPVLKALFDLLTNEEGTNVAQILTGLAQSIDKTNKILFKLLNVLSANGTKN
jgi:hypothetical protein